MAVFRGGSSVEAIETVCDNTLTINAFEVLASLIDKSMIRQANDTLGEPRFVMLETIQEYAMQCLADRADLEPDEVKRRHAQYFLSLAERAAPELQLAHQEWWFSRVDIEYNNIRSAIAWSLSGQATEVGLRIVAALCDYWWYQGSPEEGKIFSFRAMEYLEDVSPALQANVLKTAGSMLQLLGDREVADQFLTRALVIYKDLEDIHSVTWTQLRLASRVTKTYVDDRKDFEAIQDVLAQFRELDDKPGIVGALTTLGIMYFNQGQIEQALATCHECISVSRLIGDRRREAIVWANLGTIAIEKEDAKSAAETLKQGLEIGLKIKFRLLIFEALSRSVGALTLGGKADVAATVLGGWQKFHDESGIRLQPISEGFVERYVQSTQQQLTEEEFLIAREEGYKMSLDETAQFTISELNKIAHS